MAAVTGAEAPPVEDAGTRGADDTENGDKNVQEALAGKIAQLDAKKNEDKGTEKELSRMYKKASKELKEQLEAITSDSEKVKFLHQKYLDKVHHCNAADRKAENLQVSLCALGARPSPPRAAAGRRLSHPVSVCLSVCVCVCVCVCVRARLCLKRTAALLAPARHCAPATAGRCRDCSRRLPGTAPRRLVPRRERRRRCLQAAAGGQRRICCGACMCAACCLVE